MTSFTKMCVDLSNNLKSFKLSKSSSNNKNSDSGGGGSKAKSSSSSNLLEKSLDHITDWNTDFFRSDQKDKYIPKDSSTWQAIPSKSPITKIMKKTASSPPTFERRYVSSRKYKMECEDEKVQRKIPVFNKLISTPHQKHQSDFYIDMNPQNNVTQCKPRHVVNITQINNYYCQQNSYHTSPIPSRAPRGNYYTVGATNVINRPFMTPRPVHIPYSPSLSHRVMSLTQKATESRQTSCQNSSCNSPVMSCRGITVASIKQRLFNQGLRIDLGPTTSPKRSTIYRDYFRRLNRKRPMLTVDNLFLQDNILKGIFSCLKGQELLKCARVCRTWHEKLAEWRYFNRIRVHLDFKRIQHLADNAHSNFQEETIIIPILNVSKLRRINSIQLSFMSDKHCNPFLTALTNLTEFQQASSDEDLSSMSNQQNNSTKVCNQISASSSTSSATSRESDDSSSGIGSSLSGTLTTAAICYESSTSTRSSASTIDTIKPMLSYIPNTNLAKISKRVQVETEHMTKTLQFQELSVLNCGLSDRCLESIVSSFSDLKSLEIRCCNDLSEMALWTIVQPSLKSITVEDCINFSDESFSAICQLLPELQHLRVQSYHLSDLAMNLFTEKQRDSLRTVCMTQCMDITNQGIINLSQALHNLRHLSLSGCSKLTDDGLDVLCENLKNLMFLDLSWCAKITDSGLECVACDLYRLKTLILDRCYLITDSGIRHLTAMNSLRNLTLRWCECITDTALIHILSISTLHYLSITGCKRLTGEGICSLIRHQRLQMLEITHCVNATHKVKQYLKQNISNCILLD